MRHQQPAPPVVALTALLTAIAATLTLWYLPTPATPGAALATTAALAVIAAAARATNTNTPALALDVALLYLTTAATALHLAAGILGALIHALGDAQDLLQRHRATRPTYTTAA